MREFLGFTISGEYIDIAVIAENGKIIFYKRLISNVEIDIEMIKRTLLPAIIEYRGRYNIAGITLSTAGQVDSDKGIILYSSDHIGGYTGFAIKEMLEMETDLVVCVENDVNCSALAESWIGSAKAVKSLFYLSIGMGIGGGLVIDNTLISGHSFSAGEVGYLPTEQGGLESVGSLHAVLNKTKALHPSKSNWTLDKMIIHYQKGDGICIAVMDEFIKRLAETITTISYILNPELIAIGGGLKGHRDFFLPLILEATREKMMPQVFLNTTIDIPEKIQYSRMIGALRHFLLKETTLPEKDFLQKIIVKKNVLTSGEHKIAEFILANRVKVPQMTISEIANQLGLSEPTITRFCKKIEVANFQELKMILQGTQVEKQKYAVVNKSLGMSRQKHEKKLRNLDTTENENKVQKFSKEIRKKGKLYVIGSINMRDIMGSLQQELIAKKIQVSYTDVMDDRTLSLIEVNTPILILDVDGKNTIPETISKYPSFVVTTQDNQFRRYEDAALYFNAEGDMSDYFMLEYILSAIVEGAS